MSHMPRTESNATTDEPAFEREVVAVMRRLRAALCAVIGAVPGTDGIRRAADLQRALGIRSTLAWQVHKVAHASGPLTEASGVPGSAAMRRFLAAAATRGVPSDLIDTGSAALREFEELIRVHAGDRRTFDSMISGLAAEGSDRVDLQQKRAAFRANSHIWGIQAKTQLSCFVYQPSETNPNDVDLAGVRGLVGLRRFRPDASWVISRMRTSDDDGVVRRTVDRESLDPGGEAAHGVPLLRRFCSRPLPRFRSVPTDSGFINVELAPNSVGNRSAVTCLIGDLSRHAFARYQDEHNRCQRSQTLVRTPCQVLIHDVLLWEGMFGSISPQVLVYGDHRHVDPALPSRECDLLALRESVVYLGIGPSVLHTPDVPRYTELIEYAFERLGWDAERFAVYRCRVEFPVMPSSVVVQFDLPQGRRRGSHGIGE